jgi:hypothetical protein
MRHTPALCLSFGLFLGVAAPVAADCVGQNLFDTMAPAERARVEALANVHPYPAGNYWTATRGDESLVLVGTYHLDDPRHAATVAALAPMIDSASALLVEAGPDEVKALMEHMGRDPSAMFITEGPTLLERLPPETWNRLSFALAERGVPGFMAAKLQPWYATVMLAIPPCAMVAMTEPKGLDGLLIDAAQAAGVPVAALEPYDTVLKLFGGMTETQELAMIEASLATEDQAEDFAVTLAEAYFAGESRLIWELMRVVALDAPGAVPEAVDEEFAMMEELLMAARNRSWIPRIEEAAARGPVVVAFGALHLPGEAGVLNLLAGDGWQIAPLNLPAP